MSKLSKWMASNLEITCCISIWWQNRNYRCVMQASILWSKVIPSQKMKANRNFLVSNIPSGVVQISSSAMWTRWQFISLLNVIYPKRDAIVVEYIMFSDGWFYFVLKPDITCMHTVITILATWETFWKKTGVFRTSPMITAKKYSSLTFILQ